MNSRDYWKKREDEARKNTIRDEKEYNARLNEIYEYTIANIERQVNDWYARYASKEGITMAEARGRVKHIDMERYERLAAKYVATHDFSEQANQEMALYNLTMKVNRLELLKAQINLELMAGFDDIQHEMERDLIQTAMKEDRRLAGILGDSVIGNEEYAKQLVNASFRNATFSERIWGRNMPDLRIHLEAELRNGLVQGIGSDELARRFRKHYGGSIRDTERLMTTEMCRLQTAVQKESFERNGYKEYMFITSGNDNVCPDCEALHGQHFKVSEMQPGENAPPMHPRCHCSVAGYMDSDKYKRWIDALARGEDVRWNEFEAKYRSIGAPTIIGLGTGTAKESEAIVALNNSLSNVLSELRKDTDPSNHKIRMDNVIEGSEFNYSLDGTAPISYNAIDDYFFFTNRIVPYLQEAEGYVITHDVSHRMDAIYYHSWEDQGFLDALEKCAEEAYPRKAEIEGWFAEGGKYEREYALADIFNALFLGNIKVCLSHKKDYYYKDPDLIALEIFADLSSIDVLNGTKDPLIDVLVSEFLRMTQ